MTRRKQKHTKPTDWTKVPRVELIDLKTTIQFMTDAGRGSLTVSGLPDHEALERATNELASAAEDVMSARSREYRELSLRQALVYAFTIGSYGTRSGNTKSVGSSGGRKGKAQRDAERDQIADSKLQASPDKTAKQLQPEIAAEFERCKLGGASLAYLYKRRGRKRFHD